MQKGVRTAVYNGEMQIEAFCFAGIAQPFPNHFHAYYVIGSVEAGSRTLCCKGQAHNVTKGDILLFGPGDDHACAQCDGGTLDYRGLNIAPKVMLGLAQAVTGRRQLPGFSQNVIRDEEAAHCLRPFHALVMNGGAASEKEELLLRLITHLLQRYARPFENCVPACRNEVEQACRMMEKHYAQRISLEQLCRCVGVSRSTLLRAFTCSKGVTPYRYLENIRIGKAKELLAQGVPPAEAALRTGFSDQSHFTNCFGRLIGLSPGAYRDIFKKGGGHTA